MALVLRHREFGPEVISERAIGHTAVRFKYSLSVICAQFGDHKELRFAPSDLAAEGYLPATTTHAVGALISKTDADRLTCSITIRAALDADLNVQPLPDRTPVDPEVIDCPSVTGQLGGQTHEIA